MKNFKFYLIVSLIVILYSCSNNKSNSNYVLVQEIKYGIDMKIHEDELPILNELDSLGFCKSIFDKIEKGTIKAYDFQNGQQELTFDAIKEKMYASDVNITVNDKNSEKNEPVVVQGELKPSEIKELVFTETWNFDSTSMQLDKKVKNITMVRYYYDTKDTSRSTILKMPVALIKMADTITSKEGLKTISSKAEYIVHLTTCDSLFTFVNGIDVKAFAKLLITKALKGEVKVYDYFSDEPSEVNVNDIKQSLGAIDDTVSVEDVNTGEMAKKVVKGEINFDEITSLVFIEEWQFDEQNMYFVKKIKGFGPIREYYKDFDIDREFKLKTVPFIFRFDIKNNS